MTFMDMTDILVILLIVSLIASLVALLFMIVMFRYARNKSMERKNTQEKILKDKASILDQGRWFPVRYCSESRFRNLIKFFPWEATGILFISSTQAKFFCSVMSWENLELTFNREDSKIKWIGKNIWPNGFVSWLEIDSCGEKHYFTSETGTTIIGSKNTTRQIYDELAKVFDSSDIN